MKAEHIALHRKYYGQNLERENKRKKYKELKLEIKLGKQGKILIRYNESRNMPSTLHIAHSSPPILFFAQHTHTL